MVEVLAVAWCKEHMLHLCTLAHGMRNGIPRFSDMKFFVWRRRRRRRLELLLGMLGVGGVTEEPLVVVVAVRRG